MGLQFPNNPNNVSSQKWGHPKKHVGSDWLRNYERALEQMDYIETG